MTKREQELVELLVQETVYHLYSDMQNPMYVGKNFKMEEHFVEMAIGRCKEQTFLNFGYKDKDRLLESHAKYFAELLAKDLVEQYGKQKNGKT